MVTILHKLRSITLFQGLKMKKGNMKQARKWKILKKNRWLQHLGWVVPKRISLCSKYNDKKTDSDQNGHNCHMRSIILKNESKTNCQWYLIFLSLLWYDVSKKLHCFKLQCSKFSMTKSDSGAFYKWGSWSCRALRRENLIQKLQWRGPSEPISGSDSGLRSKCVLEIRTPH